jgi:hypothetical protein
MTVWIPSLVLVGFFQYLFEKSRKAVFEKLSFYGRAIVSLILAERVLYASLVLADEAGIKMVSTGWFVGFATGGIALGWITGRITERLTKEFADANRHIG